MATNDEVLASYQESMNKMINQQYDKIYGTTTTATTGTALGGLGTSGLGTTVGNWQVPSVWQKTNPLQLGGVEFTEEDVKILRKIIDTIKGVAPKKEEPDEIDQAVEDAVNALRG